MKCRLFHDWDWIQEIPGHTWGSAMTGECLRCGKVKRYDYVNWGDHKQKVARLRVPLTTQTGPPPPPPRSGAVYPPAGATVADQREAGVSDAPLSPASLGLYNDRTRRQLANGTYSLRYKGAAFGRGPAPKSPPPPARRPETTTKVGF